MVEVDDLPSHPTDLKTAVRATAAAVSQDRFQKGRLTDPTLPLKVEKMSSTLLDSSLRFFEKNAAANQRDAKRSGKIY
jgi:hypothetical protein